MDGYFVFDDINSADYKIWVKAGGTYGAASRRYTSEVVPGRNGALTIDDGAYEEKEHPYECHIGDDFPENIEAFRNAIMSKVGRFVLSDSYHTDEFYRAIYMRGLEPDVAALAKAGAFTLTFTRDPRRFLVSGDTPQNVAMNTETLSGSVVTFDNATGADSITGLSVSIMAEQAGSGDPSPSNIRPITGWTACEVTRTGKNLIGFGDRLTAWGSNHTDVGNDSYLVKSTGTGYSNPYRFADEDIDVTLSGIITDLEGARGWRIDLLDANNVVVGSIRQGTTVVSGKASKIRLNYSAGGNGAIFEKIQLELGTQATTYEPYNGASYPVTWSEAGTVYGGTLDVTNGVLTVTHRGVTFDGTQQVGQLSNQRYRIIVDNFSAIPATEYADIKCNKLRTERYNWISANTENVIVGGTIDNTIVVRVDASITDAAAWNTWASENKPFVVYKLATPITYQLTPTEITTLIGENNIWADCGDVSVTLQLPSTLINPTRFTAHPLIRVYGQGRVDVGNRSFTVSGSYPYVDIDAELGDCTYNGINANSVVSFSGGYPELLPGNNYITFSGVTKVEITPRWWRL